MWLLILCFQCESRRKFRTFSVYHLEMFVHCSKEISSTNHSNYSLVYRLFVNSIEVNRPVLRLEEFQRFYERMILK